MIFLYLVTLLIAPQLWVEPFVGIRVDLIVYPTWLIILGMKGRLNDFFNFQTIDYFIIGYIVWTLLSVIVNDSNSFTNNLVSDYIKWFVLYRLVFLSADNIEGVQKAVSRMVFLVFVIVLEGIQHKLDPMGLGWAGQPLGWVDQSVIDAGGTGRTQWINIFDGPGVFCVMYTLALPFVIQYFDKQYTLGKKLVSVISLLPLLIAIWYTGSRGGFLAALSVFGGYILFRTASKLKLSLTKLIMIGVLCFSVLLAAPSYLTQVKDENNSAQHRVDMWMEGIEMVQQNPLFGIGRGNYALYTGTLIAHNSSIQNMGELGFPGLFFWIGMFYVAFRYLYFFSTTTADQNHGSLAKAMALCLIGYLVSSMFVTLEYETQFFLLGLTAIFGKSLKVEYKFGARDFYIIASICLGWYAVLRIFTSLYY